MKVIKAVSTELVECEVDVFDRATSQPIDPTSDLVFMAFITAGVDPVNGDWKPAQWTGPKTAGILVGPDGGVITLAKGDYAWWIRIDDNPEKIKDEVDTLRVE